MTGSISLSVKTRSLNSRLHACKKGLATITELDARRGLAAIARDVAATAATDFFPGKSQDQVRSALADTLQHDDDALLLSVTPALDGLYHSYRTEQG